MRISTQTINSLATSSTNSAYENYVSILEKIASNKNFTKMSENVSDGKKLIKINDKLAKLNEYQSNIEYATNELELTYDVLNNVNDQLTEINSLIIQAADVSTTTDSAETLAATLKELVATIVDLMNTQYMDDYIFSGSNTQTQAYVLDSETGEVTYQGSSSNTGSRTVTIAEGTTMTYNVTGDSVFGDITLYSTTTDEDGNEVVEETTTDFFSEMQDLYDLLTSDTLDYDAIREKLDVISAVQDNVINQIGTVSAKVTKLDSAYSVNETTITNLTEDKADIEEVDITEAATELASAETMLEVSYTIASVILTGTSLIDYL